MFVESATKPEEQWPSAGRIEFRNFSMKYREDLELVLKDVNLTINPGEKIGIVGRTGAGKTSLTRALFRLIDSKTCSGSIVVDDQDIFSLNIGDLRPKLGIIPQEPTMFKGTFRQNLDPLVKNSIEDMWSAIIKCGIVENVQPKDSRKSNDHIDKHKLKDIKEWNKDWEKANWSKRLFLLLFITKPRLEKPVAGWVRPHGLNRRAGNSFSDGQQQIFGLCRLLMRNRKIVVLDEATANVDLETDQRMQELIRSEFKDCTVLTIAHRLETIMNSDRIIVMDSGRIAEIGSPRELLEKNGHFAELVKANDFGE
ncbi:Multidrug resistance-associated protein 1 [Coemansia sp. RSA 2399]|nr:Multidrug resistance-associated protein 1 [Coemansia sp. RSA 2399]